MRIKIIIIVLCLVAAGFGTVFGFRLAGTGSSASPPQMEASTDIGAAWDPNEVQLKYVSFAPVITRSGAIAAARAFLHDGFIVPDPENYPAEATVALYSGPVDTPYVVPTGKVVSDVPAWIVVIKGFPYIVRTWPPPAPGLPIPKDINIASIAIDARTGEPIYGSVVGKPVPAP